MISMARESRIVIPGLAHHIVGRGNCQQRVFFSDSDRVRFLRVLAQQSPEHGVGFLSYCLMGNHVHLIAIPQHESSFATLFHHALMTYAAVTNLRLNRSGHLWQGRYHSSPMDRAYLYNAVRYVERNPVRAGLVRKAWEYNWSSAAFHAGRRHDDPLVDRSILLDELVGNWEDYLEQPTATEELERLRGASSSSKPLGNRRFMKNLARRYGSRVHQRRRGRPPGCSATL